MNILRRRWALPRRTFLRSAGAVVALPWLESMGLNSTSLAKAGELAPAELPARAVFTCWGLGMNLQSAVPTGAGLDYVLPPSAKTLEPFRADSTYFTGLYAVNGGHNSQHTFLTGVDGTSGKKYGISCDQLIADAMSAKTRFPTLCLSYDRATGFGSTGAGTLSWTKNRTPVMPEDRPQVLFDKLFRAETASDLSARRRALAEQGSVLDDLRDQARRLEGRLGKNDRVRLQEYLSSIRELELQMAADAQWLDAPKPKVGAFDKVVTSRPWLRSMFDIMALALQTDSTRIITFKARNEGETRYIRERGAPCDMHMLSHNNGDETKLRWWTMIDAWEMEEWTYFLTKLKNAREGNSTIFDRTISMWGTTNGGRGAHGKQDLPAILSGGRDIGFKAAGHVAGSNQLPLGNVLRTISEKLGVKVDERFYNGAHNGSIRELS